MRTISESVRQDVLTIIEEYYTPRAESNLFASAAETLISSPNAGPDDYQRVLEYARIAHILGDSDRALGPMGAALFRMGKFDDALKRLEQGYEYWRRRDERSGAPILGQRLYELVPYLLGPVRLCRCQCYLAL